MGATCARARVPGRCARNGGGAQAWWRRRPSRPAATGGRRWRLRRPALRTQYLGAPRSLNHFHAASACGTSSGGCCRICSMVRRRTAKCVSTAGPGVCTDARVCTSASRRQALAAGRLDLRHKLPLRKVAALSIAGGQGELPTAGRTSGSHACTPGRSPPCTLPPLVHVAVLAPQALPPPGGPGCLPNPADAYTLRTVAICAQKVVYQIEMKTNGPRDAQGHLRAVKCNRVHTQAGPKTAGRHQELGERAA